VDVTVAAGQSSVGNVFLDTAPGRSASYGTTKSAKLRDNGSMDFTLRVPDSFTIWDLNLKLDITHANVNELSIDLIAPDGTVRNMMAGPAAGTDLKNITFSDEAAKPMSESSPPYVGAYQPSGAPDAGGLSRFDGKNAKGTWTLRITDSRKGNQGTLNSWSLDFKGSAGAAPAASPTAALSTAANTGTAPLTNSALTAAVDSALASWRPPIAAATLPGETDLRLGVVPDEQPGAVATSVANVAGPLFAKGKNRPSFI
jgi:subtilisin-like proprotein convertase family protein